MSNCLKFPRVEVEIPREYLRITPNDTKDTDGNEIAVIDGAVCFIPAPMTTWREFKIFIAREIVPFLKAERRGKLYAELPGVTDESDGFANEFTLQFCYSADFNKIV